MSCGVIFYKLDKNNKLQILLVTRNSILEDIGGICDNIDIQELLLNKTNFKIDLTELEYNYEIINNKYNHKILLIKASPDIATLTCSDFSNYEISGINTLIKRSIDWISIDKFKLYLNTNLISPRIKLYNLLSKFSIIESELQTEQVMKQIKNCVFYR